MILAPVRISELERAVEESRRNLDQSLQEFNQAIQKKARPWVFIKDHPKIILGFLLTAFSGTKFLGKFSKLAVKLVGLRWIGKVLTKRMTWKFLKFGSIYILKRALKR